MRFLPGGRAPPDMIRNRAECGRRRTALAAAVAGPLDDRGDPS